MTNQPTDWPAAWGALAGVDGDQWDAESKRLGAKWRAEYVEAFVAYAASRNWVGDNLEPWAAEIADEALLFGPDVVPAAVAYNDVIACEEEAANNADPR